MDRVWPSVTAVIPTRDRPQLLARAVRAVLAQDYPGRVECLVVFDQSDPSDIDVAVPEGRVLRAIRNGRTAGLAGARNSGILAAGTDLVAFCDDDDEWLPGKLRAQAEALLRVPRATMISSGVMINYRGRDRVRLAPDRPLDYDVFIRDRIMEIHPSSILLQRETVIERIGLVDEEIPGGYGEDYEFILRAARLGPVIAVHRPLVRVHWHATSFFFDRWRTIISALNYLVDKHSAFRSSPEGLARIHGQLAFAHAGAGEQVLARRLALAALRGNWREKRAVLALLVSTGLVSATALSNFAHRFGRGI